MKYILIAIALLFVVIAGQFDGAQTAKKDCGNATPMYDGWKAANDTVMLNWYEGGNHKYNPSFPSIPQFGIWFADYWHTMKFGWITAYAIAIATLSAGYFVGWKKRLIAWLLVLWFAWGLEGESFRIGYGNFYRNEPKQTVWQILSDINPFINTH